jgi:hypothetical protein
MGMASLRVPMKSYGTAFETQELGSKVVDETDSQGLLACYFGREVDSLPISFPAAWLVTISELVQCSCGSSQRTSEISTPSWPRIPNTLQIPGGKSDPTSNQHTG